jgi:hypothetical protein
MIGTPAALVTPWLHFAAEKRIKPEPRKPRIICVFRFF